MTELTVGQKAPQFELAGDGGTAVRLADFAGKIIVLYFYPKDDTKGCTVEAIDFSRLETEFAKAGAVVIGMSPDSADKHDKFKAKHGISVRLAADEGHDTLEAYGVWAQKSLYGRTYMGVVRSTFLIDRDGRIARIWKNARVRNHAEDVLEAANGI